MHAEVETFLRSKLVDIIPWKDAVVWEVGSLNVNGQARDCVPSGWKQWVGFDYHAGPGVDVVGDAIQTMLDVVGPLPHIIVTTEALEHCPEWEALVAIMCGQLRRGGWLIVTCAGTGRPPHAADGSGPPHPGEHYANVSLADLVMACSRHGLVWVHGEEGPPGDTRFVGRKV